MLTLPVSGFSRSVNVNNVRRPVLGDWLEASVMFGSENCSKSDAVDILVEEGVTDSQNMAHNIVGEGWSELETRRLHGGPTTTFSLVGDVIVKGTAWTDDLARSFLLLLSLFESYPKWAEAHRDTVGQGVLFERLCAHAFGCIFKDWYVYRAGWSPSGNKDIPGIVTELTAVLGTIGHPNPAQWAGQHANDAGLDLLCFRAFPDARECVPILALQCASGENWTKKLTEPSTNLWQKLLDSAYEPMRGLTIPFVVDRVELARRCAVIEGPLFDRNRLLSVGTGTNAWLEPGLAADIAAWLAPRVATLPFS